jgi:glycosyltransferase involved in cell wall biosynthesis
MMKVVVIADCLDTQNAGIHVYTRNLIEALESSPEFDTVVVKIKSNTDSSFKNLLVVPPLIPFLLKDPFRIFITLPKAISKLHPDIVIEPAHFGPFNLPKKIKRVTIIHDLTPIIFPQWHSFISSRLQRIFLPAIIKKASLIITNSTNTTNDLLKYFPFSSSKTAKIYPAADSFFLLNPDEISIVKQPFILSVGTVEPRKNLPQLLDAYRLFREKCDHPYQLIICGGKGWKNRKFYKKFNTHPFKNDIIIKGYVSRNELKSLYSTTSAFIYPSLYEGFGFPVGEAMGCGAPCLVSNRSSLPEVGGKAVIYFDPENVEDITNKLIDLIYSVEEIADLSNKGPKQASSFSKEQFTSNLEKFLLAIK